MTTSIATATINITHDVTVCAERATAGPIASVDAGASAGWTLPENGTECSPKTTVTGDGAFILGLKSINWQEGKQADTENLQCTLAEARQKRGSGSLLSEVN
jgi:hypothetical protein